MQTEKPAEAGFSVGDAVMERRVKLCKVSAAKKKREDPLPRFHAICQFCQFAYPMFSPNVCNIAQKCLSGFSYIQWLLAGCCASRVNQKASKCTPLGRHDG
jgi:hypothetical protein